MGGGREREKNEGENGEGKGRGDERGDVEMGKGMGGRERKVPPTPLFCLPPRPNSFPLFFFFYKSHPPTPLPPRKKKRNPKRPFFPIKQGEHLSLFFPPVFGGFT